MTARILVGDVRERLGDLADGSVHCCVTSPPYWGLRDYGTAEWEGGDPGCSHVGTEARTVSGGAGKQYTNAGSNRVFSGDCACGATRKDRQIGLEATPEEYVSELVGVFRAVRRVLREDGTLWLNLGDSYGGERVTGRNDTERETPGGRGSFRDATRTRVARLKPKDLIGVPWRVAFALQADGWWLRSDIIWSKPNPMPESVTDRPTKAHEYVFLLSKSARYWYDHEAISEEAAQPAGTPRLTCQHKANQGHPSRNARTVWTLATQPFPEAHFATFPVALADRCIRAGCPQNGTVLDPFCGAGTTGLAAQRLGRDFVGVELNPEYAAMAERRIRGEAPLFAEVTTA